MRKTAVALAMLLCAQLAWGVDKPSVKADTAAKFTDVAAEVRKQMEPGGRYEYMKSQDKQAANADLDRMTALLQKSGSADALSAPDKVQLFNAQEHLNGLLTHNDSERLVCESTRPLGSHIPTTTCKTYGEIERSRSQTRQMLEQYKPAQQVHGN